MCTPRGAGLGQPPPQPLRSQPGRFPPPRACRSRDPLRDAGPGVAPTGRCCGDPGLRGQRRRQEPRPVPPPAPRGRARRAHGPFRFRFPAGPAPARHSPAQPGPGPAQPASARPCRGSAWRRPGGGGISSCSSCGTRAGSRRAGGTRCAASTPRSFGAGESPRPNPGSIAWDGPPSQHHPFPWPAPLVPGHHCRPLAAIAGPWPASLGLHVVCQASSGQEMGVRVALGRHWEVGVSGALLRSLPGWDREHVLTEQLGDTRTS